MRRSERVFVVLVAAVPLFAAFLLWFFPDAHHFAICGYLPIGLGFAAWLIAVTIGRRPRPDENRGCLEFAVPVAVMVLLFIVAAEADTIVQVKSAPTRVAVMSDLKQIALALHAYHDQHGSFPPPCLRDDQGKPLLSWRVLLLPYLEQAELYSQFRLNESWDSQHNLPLLLKIPELFAPSEGLVPRPIGETYFQAVVGEGLGFEDGKSLSLRSDFDPSGETILVVEAREPIPWTKPDELEFTRKGPMPDLGAPRQNRLGRLRFGRLLPWGFAALMTDGTVRYFRLSDPEEEARGHLPRVRGWK